MGRFAEVVAAGVAAAVVLGFSYWGILVLLQPLLDRLRTSIHGISKPVGDPVEVNRISTSLVGEPRRPMPSPVGVNTLTVKRIRLVLPVGVNIPKVKRIRPVSFYRLSHPLDAPPKSALMTKTIKVGHLVNFKSKVYPLVTSCQKTEMVKSLKGGQLADLILMDSEGRLIVGEAKVYRPATSPRPPEVSAPNFEAFLEAHARAAHATLRSATPAQAEREFLRKFAGRTSTGILPRRQELTEFSDLGLSMSHTDALLSKLDTQMPVPECS